MKEEKKLPLVNIGKINIQDIIKPYLRYWYLFAIGIIISFLLANFYIRFYTTPQYLVHSTLLIKNDQGTSITAKLRPGMDNISSNKSISNEIIILKSRSLMEKVLLELSYSISYHMEGKFQLVEIFHSDLPISVILTSHSPASYGKELRIKFLGNNNIALIEKDYQGLELYSEHQLGKEIKKEYATFTVIGNNIQKSSPDIIIRFHNIKKLAEAYSNNLNIYLENKEANVLRINMVDPVPQKSIEIINKLIEVHNKEAIVDKNQVDVSTIAFLDERIDYLSSELADVERVVEQYKQRNNLTDVASNAQIYVESAREYNKEVGNYELQLDIINSLEDYLNQEEMKLVPSSLNIPDPTLNILIGKYNELQHERQRMLRTLQSSSSLIQNIDDQLFNLRTNIKENLKNIKNSLSLTINNYRLNSAQFQSKIRTVPSLERELLEINRQQSIKQEIYLFLLQKREEAGLSLASTATISRTIDPAVAWDYPISPKTSSIYMGAILLGLLLPFAFVYLKSITNDKITRRKEIENIIDIPILGEVMKGENENILQVHVGKNSALVETIRLVRSNLNFANIGKENKVILITSSRSGEGKTFLSVNLGASLALSGKKVIILGFDLRKPKLFQELGIDSAIGITNYLVTDDLSIDSMIHPLSQIPNLYIVGSGAIPPNPAELIMSQKVGVLIMHLKNQYDYIIIDSAPVGHVADAYSLAPYIDCSLYVIRYNYSLLSDIPILEDIYINKKFKYPMVIFNNAKKQYGYGYEYGHANSNGTSPMHKKSHQTENY